MYEFMAESWEDAFETVMNWIACGILPKQNYTAPMPNPDRAGYWYIETANWFKVVPV